MRAALTFLVLGLAGLAGVASVACTGGGDYPPVSYCSSSADCPSAMVCEFATAAGCGGQGECATTPTVPCTPQTVCSCTGATTSACVLDGYTVGTPVSATGACEGGSVTSADAGLDAGGDTGAEDGG